MLRGDNKEALETDPRSSIYRRSTTYPKFFEPERIRGTVPDFDLWQPDTSACWPDSSTPKSFCFDFRHSDPVAKTSTRSTVTILITSSLQNM